MKRTKNKKIGPRGMAAPPLLIVTPVRRNLKISLNDTWIVQTDALEGICKVGKWSKNLVWKWIIKKQTKRLRDMELNYGAT